uniref:glycan biosynthesis hexose transferase WsfD n=1 Tax=Paenibacillus sonchi TaxID=373687 RepID=UPI001F213628|nr:hypothetical protein [Paenibacillus sonchi]
MLKESSNPETTLKSFGIDEQYAILKGSIYYEQYGTVDVNSPMLEKDFYSRYGFGSILKYYATNPDQLGSILNVAARSAFSIKPAAMGNYEESEGKAFRAQSHFLRPTACLSKSLHPKPSASSCSGWRWLLASICLPS